MAMKCQVSDKNTVTYHSNHCPLTFIEFQKGAERNIDYPHGKPFTSRHIIDVLCPLTIFIQA